LHVTADGVGVGAGVAVGTGVAGADGVVESEPQPASERRTTAPHEAATIDAWPRTESCFQVIIWTS
jgi:hypothetical protein